MRKAYERSEHKTTDEYKEFIKKNKDWLEDYALYMAVKNSMEGKSWIEWDEDIRLRDEKTMESYKNKLAEDILFQQFMQFEFYEQWNKLKKYANKKGIKIIGDIPIYVAFDSADAWANPKLFRFDKDNYPTSVAGCPPDGFSATGQLWGNPLYNWDYHKKTDFSWWISRLKQCFNLYDVVRIDHFRGFDEYWAIPYGDETAEFGRWEQGPGYALFDAVKKALGNRPIIAEDLGFLTPSVLKLVKKTGYPGMKILQFAFDPREESDYLPHNYPSNSVVYTGTHDNDTVNGWISALNRKDLAFAKKYIGIKRTSDICSSLVRMALASVSDTAIIPLQDYLELGSEARINTPSTLGGNWEWRVKADACTPELSARMLELAQVFGRIVKTKKKKK